MDKIIKIGMWAFAATITLCLGLALIGAAIGANTMAMHALLDMLLGSEGLVFLVLFICIITGHARKWL